jgi:hypothetical protein
VTEPTNLPAPLGDATGQLDVELLRKLAPDLRTGLVAAIRGSATALRAGRGTVVVPEDTFDLVRRTTDAGEVLRRWRDAFEAAARECDAIAEEEALTAVGSYPGYEEAPAGSLFVPDGEGQRIAVTPDWQSGESTWDVDTLTGWIAEQTVAAESRDPYDESGGGPQWSNAEAVELIRDAFEKLLTLGRFTPAAAKVEAERKRLAGLQRDTDAAVLRQVRTVGPRRYKGVKITREGEK